MTHLHILGDDDVFLQPGEFAFARAGARIRTLLGSCVSFTAWHPKRRLGAMCHFLLPSHPLPGGRRSAARFDGRYGDEAMRWFRHEAHQRKTDPSHYEFKVFGGADTFQGDVRTRIGSKNVEQVLALLSAAGHAVKARHVGGSGHRTLVFDVASGDVWMKHVPISTEAAA